VTKDQVSGGAWPARAARPRRVWYRRPASQNAALAGPCALLVFMTTTIASAAGSVLIGLILGGIELLLGAVLLAALSPLIMLRADLIRIWHGLRFINIGMSEIAGIGMLYTHDVGFGGSWALCVWRDDGSCAATTVTYAPGLNTRRLAPAKGKGWVRQATYDPVASSQLPALNSSRAATVCRDISQRVLAAQGPDGQLATRHLERHQSPSRIAPYTQVVAYWSPDGESGRCR
jgi:hypothetical protein